MLLQALMAAEEEVRVRAASRKAKYSGPMLRYHSKRQGDTSVVRLRSGLLCDFGQTRLQMCADLGVVE